MCGAHGQHSVDHSERNFRCCSSERNNNKQQTNAKKGNMKIKNNTEITPRLTGRRTFSIRTAVESLALARNGITPGASSRRGLTGRTTVQVLAVLVTAGTLVGAIAFAQSAKEIRGASPYVAIENEPPPKLIVDPPLPEGLRQGIVWIQYRVENLRIVPVFGEGAAKVSPRAGHLHVTVDDLPWWWADASDNNTIDIAGLPVGQHKVRIELVNANHQIFPGQTKTVTFTLPVAVAHEH